ncbi:MAG: nucleotidyltransferase family protein [Chloroflexota bacterium]|jgi:hypothetical protein
MAAGDQATFEALRLAVASHYGDEAGRRWSALAAGETLDWTALAALATAHGLAPLLYAAAIALPVPAVPPEPLAHLQRSYQQTAAMNLLAEHDLAAMLHCLDEAGVQVALLKGAALLKTVYDQPAWRPMVDIDLLIQFDDLPAALAALAQIDYRPTEPEPFANRDGLYWNECLLHRRDRTSAQLELHWDLLGIPYYASRLPAAELLDRARSLFVGNSQSLALAPADLLLHLCAHNFFHHQGQLWRADVDVAFVVRRYGPELDWETFIETAVDLDLLLGVRQSLIRAAGLWFAPIPEPVLARLNALKPRARERAMLAGQRGEFRKLLRTLATLPTLGHRYDFVKGQLFPARDYLAWRYSVPTTSPALVAYARRYGSGLRGLFSELFGRSG